MLGLTKKVADYPFMVMDKMLLVPGALVTAPVGAKSVEWVKTLKPSMLDDPQLKTFDQR
jgi:branched-chain amino acid transport system substrate-binding protein